LSKYNKADQQDSEDSTEAITVKLKQTNISVLYSNKNTEKV